VRSWFGDEDAERRRRLDAQNRSSRGGGSGNWMGRDDHHDRYQDDIPQWQRRDYQGASPRGGELEERGRFGLETGGMGRMRRGQSNDHEFESQNRWMNEGRYGGEERYGNEMRYGREDYGMGGRRDMRGNYGTQFFSNDRDSESGMNWGMQDRQRRGIMGGEHRGGMFGDREDRGFFGNGGDRDSLRDRERSGMFGSHQGRGPRNFQRSDERIIDEIHMILTMHPQIDATDVEVLVEKGVVTLRGKVENRMTKRNVEDVVEDVYGVREVHNELRVDNGLLQQPQQRPAMQQQQQTPGNNLINK
jgi:hypothetical protein